MSMEEDFERPKLEPKGHAYRLADDWHTDCKGVLVGKVAVPRGFVTDGASIPRCLWPVCGDPMSNPRIYAAIVHDWLYSRGGDVEYVNNRGVSCPCRCSRKASDKIYRDYQVALGISKVKAYAEYYALRVFGGSHWKSE